VLNETSTTHGNYRWRICALVFVATTINYLDRQVISLLKDDYLAPLFKWTESDYANIVIAFQLAYAVGMVGIGSLIDKLGTKIGYALALTVWSVAAMLHAFAGSMGSFIAVRAMLGLSEAGNFPAAIKTTAEWFPKKERAFATGIFNSGTNIGAVFAPLTVPLIALLWGWEWAFILTGLIGFIWLFFWMSMYQPPNSHPKVSPEELKYIQSDTDEASLESAPMKISWFRLLSYRQTWAFVLGKFITDPIWWFYLFWLPSFLTSEYGMTKTDLVIPIAVVYSLATIGSIWGGWLPSSFLKRGWPAYRARKTGMLIFACMVLPVLVAQQVGKISPWYAVLVVSLATATHQAWSANLFTTVSDMFPKRVVASVVGIGGMAGALGGILIAKTVGLLLDYYKSVGHIETGYYLIFIFCSLGYLAAWLILHLLAPKMKRVEFH
jgi:ACS family hexuronate transporter-like MFS transporter